MGIFFDLSKAYDVLNHRVLLDKLWAYGLRGIISSWFESYLRECKQFVEINHSDHMDYRQHKYISSCKILKSGVPQGSVLTDFNIPMKLVRLIKMCQMKCTLV